MTSDPCAPRRGRRAEQLLRVVRRGGGGRPRQRPVPVGAAPVAIGRGVHRAGEGRPHLRLPVEEEVAGPVGQAAVRHQGLPPPGEPGVPIGRAVTTFGGHFEMSRSQFALWVFLRLALCYF